MLKFDNNTLLIAFVGVTAVAILLQTIILLAIFIAVRKAVKDVKETVEDLRSAIMPVFDTTRDVFARVAPKVESALDDLAAIASGLRAETEEMQTSALEMVARLRKQSARLDGMFSSLLDGVDRAGGFVAEIVSRPVRQISSIMASIKAAIESLRTPADGPHSGHSTADKDMFV